jgi:hypothetical protein
VRTPGSKPVAETCRSADLQRGVAPADAAGNVTGRETALYEQWNEKSR